MSDFISGAIAGFAQCLIGHPLDTAKVMRQNNKNFKGMKFLDFYKGVKFPLISSAIFNSVVFPTYERSIEYTNNSAISGFLAGFCVSPAVFIFDVGKIKRQTNQKFVFSDFYRTRGLGITFTRETCAMTIYFSTYKYFNETHNFSPFFAGGCSGLLNWTFTYPLDTVRSRQISKNLTFAEAFAMKKFWVGYKFCAIRAIIVNAVVFQVYNILRN